MAKRKRTLGRRRWRRPADGTWWQTRLYGDEIEIFAHGRLWWMTLKQARRFADRIYALCDQQEQQQ